MLAVIIGAKSLQKAIKDKNMVIIVMMLVVVNAKFLFSLVVPSVILKFEVNYLKLNLLAVKN